MSDPRPAAPDPAKLAALAAEDQVSADAYARKGYDEAAWAWASRARGVRLLALVERYAAVVAPSTRKGRTTVEAQARSCRELLRESAEGEEG